MSVAVERPAAEAGVAVIPPPSRSRGAISAIVLLGLGALVGAAIYAGGGSSNRTLFFFGVGAAALAALVALASIAGLVPRPAIGRAGTVSLACLVLLVIWSGLSILWSIAPDASWSATNRTLVYLLVLILGIAAGTLTRRAPTLVAGSLGVLVAGAVVWALAGKVFPTLDDDGERFARLRSPIGYWNALALLFVLALPIALWIASDRRRPAALRAASVLFLYALILGTLLTYSRGGIATGIVVLAVWVALYRRRIESLAALLVGGGAAAGVFAFALGRPGVVDDGQPHAERVADGRAFGLALLVGAVVVVALGYGLASIDARQPLTGAARRTVGRASRVGLLAAVAVVAVLLGVRGESVGDWVGTQADEFANPPTDLLTQGSERLTSISSNNRWAWWNEAWEAFREAPLQGNGAGSFATVHQLLREDSLTVTEPHNAVLDQLAGTGIVGALLACGAALAALAGSAAALRRLPERERAAGLALAVGILGYLVHSLVDFDWSYIAVTAPVLVAAGALFASARPRRIQRTSYAWSAAVLAAVAAVVVSLGAPRLAVDRVDDAFVALGEDRPGAALAAANDARSLDPLALDPLFARSQAQVALGDIEGARASLIRAVELQPLDADVWYELGAFELRVTDRPREALRYFERAGELDPYLRTDDLIAEARAGLSG